MQILQKKMTDSSQLIFFTNSNSNGASGSDYGHTNGYNGYNGSGKNLTIFLYEI